MRRRIVVVVGLLALVAAVPETQAGSNRPGIADGGAVEFQNSPRAGEISAPDAISRAELEDLEALAQQLSLPLDATVARYGWNADFALAIDKIRDALPSAFTGAEIIDAERAWIGFTGDIPHDALSILRSFTSGRDVSVEIRSHMGFTELELEVALETVHYSVYESEVVLDATTSFDFESGEITTVAVLGASVADSTLDDLRSRAISRLTDSEARGVADRFGVTVVRSRVEGLGGDDSGTLHMGGEYLGGPNTACTSGFVVLHSSIGLGVSTAGHCENQKADDGVALLFRAQHDGTHGDFQWHTGTQAYHRAFYSGSASATEANKRWVEGVGTPVVGQSLCTNGISNYKTCQEVRKLNVCKGSRCNLVQMGARLRAGGDSGGPVYWGNVAYGLHSGWQYDVFPFDRDLFSRATRMPNAIGVSIAINSGN